VKPKKVPARPIVPKGRDGSPSRPKPQARSAALLCTLALLLAACPLHADWKIDSTKTLGSPAPGVEVIETECSSGDKTARLTAILFNDRKHTLRVIDSPAPGNATLENTLRRENAIAGVNGSYFQPDFRPVGLAIADGKTLGRFKQAKLLSGIIGVTPKGAIAIIRSTAYTSQNPAFTQALQCGPMLVQNGAPVTGLESTRLARRTAVATGPNHRRALIRLTSTTLADTAKILSLPGIFGTWSTQTALNLDGGSSTGLWAAETVSLPEIKRVRNFLAVFPR
jgi:uncharacterized protein YigE (DUF2233 family)